MTSTMVPNKPLYEPVATVINGHTFTVDTRYVLKDSRILGKGSFGVVCTAYDSIRKIDMAIKRIRPYANDDWDSRHTLREIRLLKLLGPHPNIITLYELSLNEPKTELYMMMEVMDCDLHRVIQSKQPLSEKHFKCFIKQILEGIKAMHAIGVFHRDLKPGNILVSKDCQLRITDFGLARFMDESTRSGDNQLNPMTEYVVTRWYRCPELLLSPNRPYNEAIDLWSIGCILAELLRRKPLFPGKSHANQVQMIFEVLGYSNVRDLGFPVSAEASAFLDKRCKYRRQPLEKVVPDASREAIEMLEALLELNPDSRPTAVDALAFPFLVGAEVLHDYNRNYLTRPSPEFFDFEHEKYTALELKGMIELEVRLDAAYAYQYERLNSSGRTNNNSTSGSSHSSPEQGPAHRLLSPEEHSNESSRENTARPSSQQNTAVRQTTSGDASYRRMSDHNMAAGSSDDLEQGPASQLATQLRNSKLEKSKDNPFRSQQQQQQPVAAMAVQHQQGYRPHSSETGIASSNAHNDLAASAAASKNMIRSGSMINSSTVHDQSDIANGGNILQAVRVADSGSGATSRSRRSAPKTPSPQKMDAILQKDLNNKKRFVLEDMQRQREIDAQSYNGGGASNNSSAAAVTDPNSKKSSRWTFPSNGPAVAAPTATVAQGQYNSAYTQQQQQQMAADAKRANRIGGVPFPSLAKISTFGSRLSGSGGVAATGNSNSRGAKETYQSGNSSSSSNVSSSVSVGASSQAKAVPMRGSHSIMQGGSNIINSDHDLYH